MPRGRNPNSIKSVLEHGKNTRFNGKTAVEAGKKGAKVSNRVQAEKKSLQEYARIVLNTMIKRKDGEEVPLAQAGCEKMGVKWLETGDPKYGMGIAQMAGEVKQKVEQLVITPEVDFEKLVELRKALREDD